MLKDRLLCYKASAGTGKTYALTVRYLSLLLQGVHPSSILTITFTNKSANDMKRRISQAINDITIEDKLFLDKIQEQTGLKYDDILARKSQILKKYLSNPPHIMTIDKFINSILKQFAGYLNIKDTYAIKSHDPDLLAFEFLRKLEKKEFDNIVEFSYNSSKQYKNIIDMFKQFDRNNQKIKIDEIKDDIYYLAKENLIQKANIIKNYVLNHDKASKRAKDAVNFKTTTDITSSTWAIKEKFEDYGLFNKDMQNADIEYAFTEFKDAVKKWIRISNNYYLKKLFDIFLLWSKHIDEENKKENQIYFDDISTYVFKLLHRDIKSDFLYFRLDVKYDHILIDEFQDTSKLQYDILKPLIDEIVSQDNDRFRSFFYVGDTKQSIYRFRGGNSNLFGHLIDKYPQLKVKELNESYRTGKNILNYVYECFEDEPNYISKPISNISNDGFVKVVPVGLDYGNNKEYRQILQTIKAMLRIGVLPQNIAILTYTNKDLQEVYLYLKQHLPHIEISTDATAKLIKSRYVKAIINFIKYAYFQEDIYKSNFLSQLGKDIRSGIELKLDIKNFTVVEMVAKIAKYYEIFDENVVKFLEISKQFSSVVDFIHTIDNLDEAITNTLALGIRLMTIFKAKGLEFDTVLLLDKVGKMKSDTSSILLEYDDIDLKQIFYKTKNKEFFDENYRIALEKEKKLQYIDNLNTTYVALTRAKNNLLVFKKPNSSKLHIIKPKKIGKFTVVRKDKEVVIKEDKIEFKDINYGRQKQKSVQNDKKVGSIRSSFFGIATHYCLEMMEKFDKASLDISIKLTIANYTNMLLKEDFDKIYQVCQNLINDKRFQDMIKGYRLLKEQPIIYDKETKVIDLVATKDEKVLIFDYKTTRYQDETHKTQIDLYQKALKDIYQKDIYGYILYLDAKKTTIVKC
ncbi:MAG: hypothetical protein B1H07_03165 [Campylobacteraceae bacterium 4484_166]|nr:MAG: hypothetical protein B1H07_03165 [Campylobacteraceae bacterium 4484_166]